MTFSDIFTGIIMIVLHEMFHVRDIIPLFPSVRRNFHHRFLRKSMKHWQKNREMRHKRAVTPD